jgi:hypothetical protein
MMMLALTAMAACTPPEASRETTAAQSAPNAAEPLLMSATPTALTAVEPVNAPPVTFSRVVHGDAATEGQDPHIIIRLEASPTRFVELHEANHSPFDVTAQAIGGVVATAIAAPEGTAPLFYRVEQSEGEPLLCAPDGPVSIAAFEDAAGMLVLTGLNVVTFEGDEGENGITLAPLSADAVCGRLTYQRASR